MTIWNLGSINIDNFFDVPHLPQPGETLTADAYFQGLGGKGTNMSVAAARAGAHTCHIGAVGPDGAWCADRLLEYGVDTRHIARLDVATGNAMVCVDAHGENLIVLYAGANRALTDAMVGAALSEAATGDTILIQNETNCQAFCAETGSKLGLRVAYAAAPFQAEAVQAVLPYLDFLILNEVEAKQLEEAVGQKPDQLGVRDVIVTLGSKGCKWFGEKGPQSFAAVPVEPVDTTGAGDTFTGYVLACLDRGQPMEQAIGLATRAAALMVTRHGTADVIPDLKEVQDTRFD